MMQSTLVLLLGAVYTASAQTFIEGTFYARPENVVGCDKDETVVANPTALIGLADACLVEVEGSQTHSSFFNTTAGTFLHYESGNCSGTPESVVEWSDTCSSFQDGPLTVSYTLSAPKFNGDQVVWANYYASEDCSGEAYQLGSDAPSTTVVGQCTGYYRKGGDPQFATITNRVNNDEVVVQYYRDPSKLCIGAPTETMTYAIDECIPGNSTFGSLKIMTNAPVIPFLSGQVNLNEDAANLNKQIAGASIGVLCGFTALLICISMTGILG